MASGFSDSLQFGVSREQAFKQILQGTDIKAHWTCEFAPRCWLVIPSSVKTQIHENEVNEGFMDLLKTKAPAVPLQSSTPVEKSEANSAHDLKLEFADCIENSFEQVVRAGSTGTLTLEVKSHPWFKASGNVAVEFEQRDWFDDKNWRKPSGIALSTADYWAHEILQDCWLVLPTELQREMNEDHISTCGKVKKHCGDNDNTCSLIYMNLFVKFLQEYALSVV